MSDARDHHLEVKVICLNLLRLGEQLIQLDLVREVLLVDLANHVLLLLYLLQHLVLKVRILFLGELVSVLLFSLN